MRGWHVAATGAGLIAVTVLAPVVSGTVWAMVAAPGAPRDPIAPALVVSFDRVGGDRGVPVPTTSASAVPHSTDDDYAAPQTIGPDRVREVPEVPEVESHADDPSEEPTAGAGHGKSSSEPGSGEDDD